MEKKLNIKFRACALLSSLFVACAIAAPVAPTITNSSSIDNDGNYIIEWNANSYPSGTRFVLVGEGRSTIYNQEFYGNYYEASNMTNGSYSYKVKACSGSGSWTCGSYSPKFTVDVTVPDVKGIKVASTHFKWATTDSCGQYPCIKSRSYDGKTKLDLPEPYKSAPSGGMVDIINSNSFVFTPRSEAVPASHSDRAYPHRAEILREYNTATDKQPTKYSFDLKLDFDFEKSKEETCSGSACSTISVQHIIIFQDMHIVNGKSIKGPEVYIKPDYANETLFIGLKDSSTSYPSGDEENEYLYMKEISEETVYNVTIESNLAQRATKLTVDQAAVGKESVYISSKSRTALRHIHTIGMYHNYAIPLDGDRFAVSISNLQATSFSGNID